MNKQYLFKMTVGLFAAAIPVFLTAADSAAPKADPKKIREHVKYLASDALEGRGTGQKGGDLAADYIAAEFKKYGLAPAGDNGTYFQQVPMVGVKTLPSTTFALEPANGSEVSLKNMEDFVTNNGRQTEMADFDAPIVFVGFGITAPEYKWDDYKGVDLQGKVALLFVAEPESTDPAFFKGKALTYYGRWTYKFEETARHGAIATLVIHRMDLASYGWEVVRNSWGTERSHLKLDGTPKLAAASWVQLEVAKKIAALSGLNLDTLYKQAQSRDFKPVELPVRLKAHIASEIRPFSSRNVVARLNGADAKLKDQAVLYTAHYDHLGINPAMQGDNIYNGAVDNATGCGILLELARAWSKTKPAPSRSILFAAVTAEEQGLFGSEYLGKHPPIPAGKIALDLNFDALPPLGVPREVDVSGAERTTFYPFVQSIAKEFGFAIKPDAHPEAGHYYRSDHFSLARVGVPSFSINEGMLFKGHDAVWGEAQAADYVQHNYHAPSDEFRENWDFAGLGVMTNFGYTLGKAAANNPQMIQWLPGDEFEAARKAGYAAELGQIPLFENLPELKIVEYLAPFYPPLARQTRISGMVKLNVSLDQAGKVVDVKVLSGHPLLVQSALDNIRSWKFAALHEPQQFEIAYDFVLDSKNPNFHQAGTYFVAPGKISVVSFSPPDEYGVE